MSVLTSDLTSHLALVTGASGGIGKATLGSSQKWDVRSPSTTTLPQTQQLSFPKN